MTPASLLAARRCERLVREGSAAGAEPILRDALAEARRSGRPRAVARAALSLHSMLREQGRHAESAEALEQAVEAHRRMDGVAGRWTGEWRNELIGLYGSLGRLAELESICREQLSAEVHRHGERSAEAAWARLTLAWALRQGGRWEESEALCRTVLGLIESLFGADHPRTGWALVGLALARTHDGDPGDAEALLRRAREGWERVGHADRVAAVDELLIDLYACRACFGEALELSRALFGRPAALTAGRRLRRVERHAALLRAAGRTREAASWDARACELRAAGTEAPSMPGATCCASSHLTGPVFPSPLL